MTLGRGRFFPALDLGVPLPLSAVRLEIMSAANVERSGFGINRGSDFLPGLLDESLFELQQMFLRIAQPGKLLVTGRQLS